MNRYRSWLVLAPALFALGMAAEARAGVSLVHVEPLPWIGKGDFDQFAVDLKRDRLYLSAEAADQIEVFDLRTGALLESGGDIKAPHRLAVDESTGRLFAADGDDGSVKVMTPDLKLIKRIPVGVDPDGGVYDAAHALFYVGSRTGDGPDAPSQISVISTTTLSVVRALPVPAHTLKDMVIDERTNRLFVSMRDKNQIGVLPLSGGVMAAWAAPAMNQNVPLALDPGRRLLFAGGRRPGKLVVFDADDGRALSTLDCTDVSDSMTYDRQAQRLYVTGTDGLSVYGVRGKADVAPLALKRSVGGKSSIYVPSLRRLYVARPKADAQAAALEVYDVDP
jgi:DNA-binding beta-propeller fold protein YncE